MKRLLWPSVSPCQFYFIHSVGMAGLSVFGYEIPVKRSLNLLLWQRAFQISQWRNSKQMSGQLSIESDGKYLCFCVSHIHSWIFHLEIFLSNKLKFEIFKYFQKFTIDHPWCSEDHQFCSLSELLGETRSIFI